MKTTIDLPDKLLIEAKATAARRRTTLKAIIEHALKREIETPSQYQQEDSDSCFEINEDGLPILKTASGRQVTSEMVYEMMDEEGI